MLVIDQELLIVETDELNLLLYINDVALYVSADQDLHSVKFIVISALLLLVICEI